MQVSNPPPAGAPAPVSVTGSRFLSSAEWNLALVVLAFGGLVILVLTLILRQKSASADDAIRCYAITMIITGTMFLICAGYSNDQIAPAMGLFGTLAGYLLGRKGSQQ